MTKHIKYFSWFSNFCLLPPPFCFSGKRLICWQFFWDVMFFNVSFRDSKSNKRLLLVCRAWMGLGARQCRSFVQLRVLLTSELSRSVPSSASLLRLLLRSFLLSSISAFINLSDWGYRPQLELYDHNLALNVFLAEHFRLFVARVLAHLYVSACPVECLLPWRNGLGISGPWRLPRRAMIPILLMLLPASRTSDEVVDAAFALESSSSDWPETSSASRIWNKSYLCSP